MAERVAALEARVAELEKELAAAQAANEALREKNARMEASFTELMGKFGSLAAPESPSSSSASTGALPQASSSSSRGSANLSRPSKERSPRNVSGSLTPTTRSAKKNSAGKSFADHVRSTLRLGAEPTAGDDGGVGLGGGGGGSGVAGGAGGSGGGAGSGGGSGRRVRANTMNAAEATTAASRLSSKGNATSASANVSPRNSGSSTSAWAMLLTSPRGTSPAAALASGELPAALQPGGGLSHKAWGVALRDHFATGVTLPSAVSHLMSFVKQYVMEHETGDAQSLFHNVDEVPEDATLRRLLEFGDGVPVGTPIEVVCQTLVSYLVALPEPLVLPEATALLREAINIDDAAYQAHSVRAIVQSTLPYNHRVLLQALVSLLSRLQQAAWPVDDALEAIARASFASSVPLVTATGLFYYFLGAGNEAFPSSDLFTQYQVDRSTGAMLSKSAEPGHLTKRILHRFMQETRTTAALLALSAQWIPSPLTVLDELSLQHAEFAKAASDKPEQRWRWAARSHVLYATQQWVELMPELLYDGSNVWNTLRKAARAWQRECVDGGEPERKLRKWLKSQQKAQSTYHAAVVERVAELSRIAKSVPPMSAMEVVERLDPKVVAEQICLLDSAWFRAIPKSELMLYHELSDSKSESSAPNWWRMIRSFNLLSQWTCTAVLTGPLPSTRAATVAFFLKVADHLQNVLANYNASYAIISALSDSSVERLKQTWSRVAQQYLDLNQQLQTLWSVTHNFRAYRNELARAKEMPPAIPYCGLLSKDLFAVAENNRSAFVASPMGSGPQHVNVDRFRLLWEKMDPFLQLQRTAEYPSVVPRPDVLAFLVLLGNKAEGGLQLLEPGTYKAVSTVLEARKKQHPSADRGTN